MVEVRAFSDLGVDVSPANGLGLGRDLIVEDIGAVRMEALSTHPPTIKIEFLDLEGMAHAQVIGNSLARNIDAIYRVETSEILARFVIATAEREIG
jgi:hypothetical protein